MTGHSIATREAWLEQRLDLLEAEKAHTRAGDELARRRRQLPWVRVDKAYRFATANGEASLAELFDGRSQLLVYHFMFGPDFTAGCPSCSAIADGFNGAWTHLANHDVMLWAVSRAPLDRLQAYKARMGWTFPWASSAGSDFNADYAVGFTEAQQDRGYTYNYRENPPIPAGVPGAPDGHDAMCGVDLRTYLRELPGLSAFILDEGQVFHTYSTYSRGLDAVWNMYPWLDRAPLGRNEAGRWWRRRDEYPAKA